MAKNKGRTPISRRDLPLAAGLLSGPAGQADASARATSQPAPAAKTVLAIGAHYDDCVFGVPGILLRAVRKRYRVVILNLIGDYTSWAPIDGRAGELIEGSVRLAREHGIEMRFLDFKSHQFEVDSRTKRAVARAVAEIRPEIAFHLWNEDTHDDHRVAARLSSIALRGGGSVLEDRGFRPARRIYAYDNGPRHTIGFVPDTFVDISPEWETAINWLGRLMALVRNETYDPRRRDGAQQMKEAIASYRGKTCGVAFAEAVYATSKSPQDIF